MMWDLLFEFLDSHDQIAFARTDKLCYCLHTLSKHSLCSDSDSANSLSSGTIKKHALELFYSTTIARIRTHCKRKKLHTCIRTVVRDLVIVSHGLRTSCLLDYIALAPKNVIELIGKAMEQLGIRNVIVIDIDDSFLLMNALIFLRQQLFGQKYPWNWCLVMDVRTCHEIPYWHGFMKASEVAEGVDSVHAIIHRNIVRILISRRDDFVVRLREQDLHGLGACLIVGVFLRYHGVYYTEPAANSNCIGMCPLIYYTVGYKLSDVEYNLYSFSIPCEILRQVAKSWGKSEAMIGKLAEHYRIICVLSVQKAISDWEYAARIKPFAYIQERILPTVAL